MVNANDYDKLLKKMYQNNFILQMQGSSEQLNQSFVCVENIIWHCCPLPPSVPL